MHQDFVMMEFHLVEFLLLFRRQFRRDLPLGLLHRIPDPLRRLHPDRFEFGRARVDDRRDLGGLFGGQIEGAP